MMRSLVITGVLGALAVANGAEPVRSTPAAIATAPIEFAGYSFDTADRRFVLHDSEAKVSSPFLRLGQSWRGYELVSFDLTSEYLTVKNRGETFSLPMQKPQRLAAINAQLQGKWISVEMAGPGADSVQSMALTFQPDGQVVATGVLKDGKTDRAEGRYTFSQSSFEMLMNGGRIERGNYGIEDGVLTLRPTGPTEGVVIKMKREDVR